MPTARHRPPIDDVLINAVLIAVRQAANVVCDRWSLVLLLSAHAGAFRFAELRERTGMATRQLTKRLAALESQGILVKLPYSRRPLRHGYHLTHMGLALFDFFATMVRWEHTWHPPGAARARVAFIHTACAATDVDPVLCCAECHEPLTAASVGRLQVAQKAIQRMPPKETGYRRAGDAAPDDAAAQRLPLAQCTRIFGDKWSIEVIVAAFLRVTTFGGFQGHTGISTNVLADRLGRLVELGVFRQTTADEPGRTGTYELSAKGVDLYPVLLAIQAWADDWLLDRYRSPVRLRHRPCGAPIRLRLACDACGEVLLRGNSEFSVAQGGKLAVGRALAPALFRGESEQDR